MGETDFKKIQKMKKISCQTSFKATLPYALEEEFILVYYNYVFLFQRHVPKQCVSQSESSADSAI